MLKFLLRRFILMVPVVIGITLFIYLIMDVAPGDPARLILGADATMEEIEAKREEMGLNLPVLVRYARYMMSVASGDFGVSWFNNYNVLSEFLSRLPNTLTLGLLSTAIAAIVGIPFGIIAAVRQYHVFDYATLAGAMLFSSMPAFWFGLMAQVYLALNMGLLPATGVGSISHFVLPALTLSAASLASQVRMTRTSMLEVMRQDYVRTARAKGAAEPRVIVKHVLRNGMLPVVTQLGIGFAHILGGAIVTETVFAIPGVASLLLNAVKLRDVPVVMGIILIIAVFVGLVNLMVDLIYAVIDPRVKSAYGA